MTALHYRPTPVTRAAVASALTLTALGSALATAPAAEADSAAPGQAALGIAMSKAGAPYVYGATGPSRFDCSGLTLYAFDKAGVKLPRTAQQQYESTNRVPASDREIGDLVFFGAPGSVYHVGIYAGKGRIWHSPKSGAVVRSERIWSENVRYGRVG